MNEYTLRKLAANPSYRLNPKQQAELDELDRNRFVPFGNIDKHQNEFEHHPTGIVRRKRVRKSDTDSLPVQDKE